MKCPDCLAPYDSKLCDDPKELKEQPIGMYHCPNCGVMQLAGFPHINCDTCNGKGTVDKITEGSHSW